MDLIFPHSDEGLDLYALGAPVSVGKMCRTDLVHLTGFRDRIERAPISKKPRKPLPPRNESNPR